MVGDYMSIDTKGMKPGDIIFLDSGTKIGAVVKATSRFQYSHVAIYMGNNKVFDIDFQIKSTIRHISNLKVKGYAIKRLERSDVYFLDIANMMSQKKYDFTGAFKMVLAANGIRLKKTYNYRYWCSELVDDYFARLGVPLTEFTGRKVVTIKDLYESSMLREIKTVPTIL